MSGRNGYSRERIVSAIADFGKRKRGRVLDGLAQFNGKDHGGPIPERARTVRAILEETRDGRGVEDSPGAWKARAIGLCRDAIDHGADPAKARAIVEAFLSRMAGRFEAFETSLWRWAFRADPCGPPTHLGPIPFHDLGETALALFDLMERRAIEEEGRADA